MFEQNGKPFQTLIGFEKTNQVTIEGVSSFISLQLNDDAYQAIRRIHAKIVLTIRQGAQSPVEGRLDAFRFKEIFPRQGYALHLIGWIAAKTFLSIAKILPPKTACYF